MNINFHEVRLKNFICYKDLVFPFVRGKHLVTGKNGAGKTTAMEAISACLYNISPKGKDPSFLGAGNASVTVIFSMGEDQYEITRRWRADGKSPEVLKNGEDITPRKPTDANNLILDTIGLTYQLFISTVTVAQNLPINFCTMTPTIRKALIEEMIGFGTWDMMRKKVKNFHYKKTNDYKQVDSNFHEKRESMISLNSKIETLASVQVQVEQADAGELKKLREDLATSFAELSAFAGTIPKFSKQEQKDKIDNFSAAITISQEKYRGLSKIVVDKICYACNRPYPEDQLDTAERESKFLQSKIQKLEGLKVQVVGEQKEVNDKLTVLEQKYSKVESKRSCIEKLTTKKEEPKKIDVKPLEEELTTIREEVANLKRERGEQQEKIDAINYIDSLLLPSSKFRSDCLANYTDHINVLINQTVPLLFPDVSVNLILSQTKTNGIDIEIKRDKHLISYDALSGGQKRRIEIALIFSFQRLLQTVSDMQSNLLVFDEIFTGLDNEGVADVLNCLDQIFPEANSIYVITHKDNVRENFDTVIRVNSDGFGCPSTIECLDGFT